HAAAADPLATEPQIVLARADERHARAAAARDRLLALTLLQSGSIAAWDALASWAGAHGDSPLMARALREAVQLPPGSRADIALRAVKLAGDGDLVAARAIAGAALDVDGPRVSPEAVRLAIDDALVAGDVDHARVRAVRGHVGLDEAAGRALLMGNAEAA